MPDPAAFSYLIYILDNFSTDIYSQKKKFLGISGFFKLIVQFVHIEINPTKK